MVFVIFYSISLNAPFIQGIIAFVVCMIILIMDARCAYCVCVHISRLFHTQNVLCFFTSLLFQFPAVSK
jgi:hypothetical protein